MLYCSAVKCVHNNRYTCNKNGVTVTFSHDKGAYCGCFKEIPNYKVKNFDINLPYDDSEFAHEISFDNNVSCSCTGCLFNVHYSCKAKILHLKQNGKDAKCTSYYKI